MKRFVKITVNTMDIKEKSMIYIDCFHSYNINCESLNFNSKQRIFDQYELSLVGKEENIYKYLKYLKEKGFRIVIFDGPEGGSEFF